MARPIRWTPEALRTYVSIMRYLDKYWTAREMERFDREVDEVLSVIAAFPYAARSGAVPNVREAVVKPWNVLFYRIHRDRVELLVFWDARRNPRTKPRLRRRPRRS